MLDAKRRLIVAWRSFKQKLFGDATVQIGSAVYIIDVHGHVKRRLGEADDGLDPLPPSRRLIDHINNEKRTHNTAISRRDMARPKPTVLLEHVNKRTYRSEQVIKAVAIYAVFYQGHPINLRSLNSLVSYPGPKYKKTAFPNSGAAFNLAERLNKMFDTDDFTVVMLDQGTVVQENTDS